MIRAFRGPRSRAASRQAARRSAAEQKQEAAHRPGSWESHGLAKVFTFCYIEKASLDSPVTDSTPRFGFVAFAETWNGRLAMLGFVIGLGTELLTGQGILSQVGLG